MIYIAIDPGVNNGFVVIDTLHKTNYIKSLSFWQCIKAINKYKQIALGDLTEIKCYIEDPNYNRPVFPKKGAKKEQILHYMKIAQNVGENKRIATLLIEYCKILTIPVEATKPHPQGKVRGEYFEEVTGIKTNQHCRDAYMILIRKNIIQLKHKS